MFEAGLKRCKIHQIAETALNQILNDKDMGAYWLPSDEYVLGFAAGRRIARLLLKPDTSHYYQRTVIRSVITEIAHLIRHRTHGTFKDLVLAKDPEAINLAIEMMRRDPIKTISSLERIFHGVIT